MCFAAKKGNSLLGCIRKSMASRSRDVVLSTQHWGVSLECWVHVWSPQYTRDIDILNQTS